MNHATTQPQESADTAAGPVFSAHPAGGVGRQRPHTPSAGSIELRVTRQNAPTRRLRINASRCTFGSGEDCTVRLDDPDLRPLHAVLLRDADGVRVCAQSVAIEVNGQPAMESVLHRGNIFRLGQYSFELVDLPGASERQQADPMIETLQSKIAELSENLASARSEAGTARQSAAAEHAQLQARIRENERAEAARQDAEAQEHAALLAELQQMTAQRDQAQRVGDETAQQRDEALRERDAVLHRRDEAQQQCDEALQQRDESLRALDEAQQQRDEALHQCDEAHQQRDEALRERDEALHELDEARCLRDKALEQRSSAIDTEQAVQAKLREVTQQVVQLQQQLDKAQQQAEQEQEQLHRHVDQLAEELAQYHAENERLRSNLQSERQSLEAHMSRLLQRREQPASADGGTANRLDAPEPEPASASAPDPESEVAGDAAASELHAAAEAEVKVEAIAERVGDAVKKSEPRAPLGPVDRTAASAALRTAPARPVHPVAPAPRGKSASWGALVQASVILLCGVAFFYCALQNAALRVVWSTAGTLACALALFFLHDWIRSSLMRRTNAAASSGSGPR